MTKQSKLHIKNTQLAEAINLRGLKEKLSRKKSSKEEVPEPKALVLEEEPTFSEEPVVLHEEQPAEIVEQVLVAPEVLPLREAPPPEPVLPVAPPVEKKVEEKKEVKEPVVKAPAPFLSALRSNPEKLGPVLDKKPSVKPERKPPARAESKENPEDQSKTPKEKGASKKPKSTQEAPKNETEEQHRQGWKWPVKGRGEESADSARRPRGKGGESRPLLKKGGATYDARLRHGVTSDEEEGSSWRRRRPKNFRSAAEQQPEVQRPTKISTRLPVSVKDLASAMKLKASQLISTLFLQGAVVTLNDELTDETMIQLLGHELGCEVEIDTKEADRLQVTGQTIAEEIKQSAPTELIKRPPVVAFMGHVDHGKTSLIDAIRRSNRAEDEVGAITQHIGAFRCETQGGPVTIIDTPGHEAFSAMRERGVGITDVVVLVIAGDEGIKEQTIEALKQAKEGKVTVLVAINKCDKPNFDLDRVFRQLADHDLLPETWGGHTVTVSCSALTKQGIPELLEMIALQADVLELRANPNVRARGVVIESEMTKGLGPVATVLIQNGTLRRGDCLVFATKWARVKSMRDENNTEVESAAPSTPVRINGLSGIPEAGEEFIVVKNEKEAKGIAEGRKEGERKLAFQSTRKISLENMMQQAAVAKKVLTLVVRADVQGSLEALKTALTRIPSEKVEVNIISFGVGEVTESDVQLAAASKAQILGFHVGVEAHADLLARTMGVPIHLHTIIYHAIDEVRELMRQQLDKIAQEVEKGKAEIRAIFKSSQLGLIAGCQVTEGSITRNCLVRVRRNGELLWQGPIDSLKRFKDDVKEVQKGTECGIVFHGFSDFAEQDSIEGFEVVYIEPQL